MSLTKVYYCAILICWLGEVITSVKYLPNDEITWLRIRTRLLYPQNFASVRINSHNEREVRVCNGKILALETYMSSGYSSDYDMVLRQITDGRRILQAVYQGGVMKECDYSIDSNQMLDFVSHFMSFDYEGEKFGNISEAITYSNYTRKNILLAYRSLETLNNIEQLHKLADMQYLQEQCQIFLDSANSIAKKRAFLGNLTVIHNGFFVNTEPEKIKEFNKELYAKNTDKHIQYIHTSEHNLSKRSTASVKRSRSKRASFDFSSVLIFPGTKWCGKGDLAQCYEDLGDDHELDACCRDHDCCPFIIPPFSNKFGVFNYRFHSLIHCDCDQRFRGCLRESVSSMANMIGKIYFNILGSKCFDFQEREVCAERSWWGRCQRYENQTLATVKSQVSFFDKDGNEDYVVVNNKKDTK